VVLFCIAFYLLSQVIKVIPLGIAYAIWAGVGIVLTAIVGYVIFKQALDLPAFIGIALIISGVVVINLFSQTAGHYKVRQSSCLISTISVCHLRFKLKQQINRQTK